MLISPVILVRLLSVHEFGMYREFLVYVSVLASIAGFGVNSSLLRFVPDDPQTGWRYVDQVAALTFASSLVVTAGALSLNSLTGGAVLGDYALRVALYVLLFVNLDFWEFLWLAERRSYAVLGYSTGRLLARVIVVTSAAALTREVDTVIWSLIGLESMRLTISAVAWRSRARTAQPGEPRWREHLEYCVPFGGAVVLVALNKSLGALCVAKMLGPVSLAHYAIGTYLEPVVKTLRNSLSDVLLPEMVSRKSEQEADPLALWRRSTVVAAVGLVGVGVVLGRFAEPLIAALFSTKYLPAVPVFQCYLLIFLRESVDFAVPLRARDRTGAILRGNLIAFVVNGALIWLLLPSWGLLGAVAAYLVARAAEGVYLGLQTMRFYGTTLARLAAWKDLAKVLVAAALAYLLLIGSFWTERLGLFGAALGAVAFFVAYVALLVAFRIPEATALLRHVRSAPAFILRRLP